MIKVSLEVHEGTAPFRVAARAESISQAVSIVKGFYPDHEVRVVFPIDSEEFFTGDPEMLGAGGVERTPVSGVSGGE